jgi:hypothetical protein
VYDMTANAGWVSVGITSDTAEFAVASAARWEIPCRLKASSPGERELEPGIQALLR